MSETPISERRSALAVRLRHYHGQRLTGVDLQDEYNHLSGMRGLHVVALHDTWGIALGFQVRLAPPGQIVVGPGLAYDCFGRELVLAHSRVLPGPHLLVPGQTLGNEYALVMSYDPGLGQRQARQELIPCEETSGPLAGEQPAFAWRQPGTVRVGVEVPVVGVRLTNGGIDDALNLGIRQYTQPAARPHIVAGITPREQRWELWREEQGDRIVGLQIRVDTRDAGFVGTPYYLASLRGLELGSTAAQTPVMVFSSLAESSPSGFTFRIIVALGQTPLGFESSGAMERISVSRQQTPSWQVSWLGIEPVMGCAPHVDWAPLIARILSRPRPTPVVDSAERNRLFAASGRGTAASTR